MPIPLLVSTNSSMRTGVWSLGELSSSVMNQYGRQIRATVLETLERLGVTDAQVTVVDKGALDCTLKARIEGAVFRSVDQYENLPWGGAIR